jgi:hypothetical protein
MLVRARSLCRAFRRTRNSEARFAGWPRPMTRSSGAPYQLLNSLVGEAEKLAGVPKTKSELSCEHSSGISGAVLSFGAFLLGSSARSLVSPQGRSDVGRQTHLLIQLHGICLVDPKGKSFAQTPPGLVDRPPVRMAAPHSRNASEPGSALVSLEHGSIAR